MKCLILSSLALICSTGLLTTASAQANENRRNCGLTNAGGCVKLANKWMEFCPAKGREQIDGVDKNDRDCISVKPFAIVEGSSTDPSVRHVVKSADDIAFESRGGVQEHTFGADCTLDKTQACAISPPSIGAVKFSVGLKLSESTDFMIDLFIFSQSGTVSFDNRQYNVEAGSFKFDLGSTEQYNFINPDCDTVTLEVEMKTLGGNRGDHTLNVGATATSIDGHMTVPRRYGHFPGTDSAASVFGPSAATTQTVSGTPVVALTVQQLPNGDKYRFGSFVTVPPPSYSNNANGRMTTIMGVAAAAVSVLAGMFI